MDLPNRAYLGAVAVLCTLSSTSIAAGDKISGRARLSFEASQGVTVGPAEDAHRVVIEIAKGTNTSVGQRQIFDGDTVARTMICDVVQGNGTCYGYQSLASDQGDSAVAKFSGVIQTSEPGEGNGAEVTFRGIWIYVKGTGRYANLAGGGAYEGSRISGTEYVLTWSGELQ